MPEKRNRTHKDQAPMSLASAMGLGGMKQGKTDESIPSLENMIMGGSKKSGMNPIGGKKQKTQINLGGGKKKK